MKRLLPAAFCLLLLAPGLMAPLPAQQAMFRSAATTVGIYATVVDREGRLVPDLGEQHFEVYDNGKLQTLTLFKSDVQPITVVAMLDTSGSMTLNLDFLKTAAERFALRLLPEDKARIGSFSDKIRIMPQFTSNRDDLVRYLHNDIQFGNPTFLWDAIDESMSALSGQSGRRVVLIFTDGEDDRSQRVDFDDVLRRAQNENFMIYAIGLQSEIPASGRGDRGRLLRASENGRPQLNIHTRGGRTAPPVRSGVQPGEPRRARPQTRGSSEGARHDRAGTPVVSGIGGGHGSRPRRSPGALTIKDRRPLSPPCCPVW
jgi:hypothetical protein